MDRISVGRIVHYFPEEDPETPMAAIVTRVWSDDCVNLRVFADGVRSLDCSGDVTSITRRTEQNTTICWDWPKRS